MKLRNIISVLSAALFFATACTNDDLDRSDDSKGTKLTLSLTTKAVVTKTTAEGYEHSTPDEIKINNVAIAFFKGDERVGFQYVTFKDGIAAGNLEDGRAYYKVENMTVQGGDLKVLVLANSSLPESELQAADTPAKFKNLKETLADNGARTFDPSNLVKFGESDVEVVPGKSKEQQVELTQLAARIDLSFKVNMPDTEWNEEEYWQYTLEDLKKYGKNPDHIAGKPDSIRECKSPVGHTHPDNGKYLEVMNRKTIIQTKTTYFFDIKSVTIENVNRRSLSFLDTYNSSSYIYNTEELGVASYTIPVTDGLGSISLYSYEKSKNTETPVKVSVTGRLSQKEEMREKSAVYQNCYKWCPAQGSGWSDVGYFDLSSSIGSIIGDFVDKPAVITPIDLDDHTYSLELNPKESATTHTNGLVHGNLYDVVGKIDMKTYRVEYTWTLLPWNTRVREVSVDIVDPAFLVVADLEIIMPNVTSISTLFSSSSPVTISNIKTENGTKYPNTSCTITPSSGNSGTITISTVDVPCNFVPKYISFTVTNKEGLSEDVKVTQYPPLYITNYVSKKGITDDGSGQTNSNMYIFNSLIADYRGIKDPTDLNYDDQNATIAEVMAKYIREHAVLGYPETKDVPFNRYVYSRKNGSAEWQTKVYIGTVPCTNESEDNNYRISPRFVLASQNGTNKDKYELSSKEFCAGYVEESNNQNDFTSHQYGDWRVPTKAELLLIDVLQNTEECEVKKILEGGHYNCALPKIVEFMDPRVGKDTKAVRCVRDIKE